MSPSRRGFSLIVVLAALVIISLLLLALFSGAAHSLRFAGNGAILARERMLADTAATLVMAQLQQATARKGLAWISQPGLVRTYAADSAARRPGACYKLYSAPQMIDTSGSVAFLAADVPANWAAVANQSVYTDLNAPARPLFGRPIYPILDADAVGSVTGLSADAGHAVEMPVAWLYELRDGTLGSPDAATTANPIVGRIAFWTDDETSKIDLNTAGELSAWNVPRSSSRDDAAWAAMQPASGEFERYPGHPGGVSLGVLFGAGTTANLDSDQLLALTPRYAAGGSEFGTQTTTATSSVIPKAERIYGSVDELFFGTGLDASGQRVAGPITADELNRNRFVLTAHSESPETTLLGEPRIAIWPVSDAPKDSDRTTATDRAVRADAEIGATPYFFQRHAAANATDDLDRSIVPGNADLLTNLEKAGNEQLPGCTQTFLQKYPGAQWPQLVLELLDAIRGYNAVDPAAGPASAPTSFVPFAAGDGRGVGRGLIVPLTSKYPSATLRGLGRYPTLFGLTLVLYVSGYGFTDGTTIDYETAPDDFAGTNWKANFQPVKTPGSRWNKVNQALVRAFIVPTTFQPNCGFPEVSEACAIRITGLNALTATSRATTENFGFPAVCKSRLLSDALTVLPADRAWGGYEGPLAWRAAALDAMGGGASYALAGTRAVAVPLEPGAAIDSKTGGPSLPNSWVQTITTAALTGLKVEIIDRDNNPVQTCTVDFPAVSGRVPTSNGEADHEDGSTPESSQADWATSSAHAVAPSFYMTLRNRVLATQRSRALMIQAGDLSYSVEARTDLRLVASLNAVPASFFGPATTQRTVTAQGGTHQHDLRFADGTGACFGTTQGTMLAAVSYANTTASLAVTDWRDGSTRIAYPYATSPAPGAPTGTIMVTMAAPGSGAAAPLGDWDTGPGLAPDGALANLPDAGTTLDPSVAYESLEGGEVGAATCRSPNALVPSPVAFGSLPAGVNPEKPDQSQPWRTLVFCPYPAGGPAHPGLVSPPDDLLLDRFWMPVVEPYGISGRFTTAGKINLNDQIAPFTYLHRNTALHALLRNLRIPAITPSVAASFKTAPAPANLTIWDTVDENATITQIENRFAAGDAYLTEGEICSVPLLPQNLGGVSPETFWTSRGGAGFLTGDNLRELPYAQIYSRLTTRSNSYTVHIRAQVLQKLNDRTSPGVWREGVDQVIGDWRGSCEIERYLDPNATAPDPGTPLGPYKFRVVSERRFTP